MDKANIYCKEIKAIVSSDSNRSHKIDPVKGNINFYMSGMFIGAIPSIVIDSFSVAECRFLFEQIHISSRSGVNALLPKFRSVLGNVFVDMGKTYLMGGDIPEGVMKEFIIGKKHSITLQMCMRWTDENPPITRGYNAAIAFLDGFWRCCQEDVSAVHNVSLHDTLVYLSGGNQIYSTSNLIEAVDKLGWDGFIDAKGIKDCPALF